MTNKTVRRTFTTIVVTLITLALVAGLSACGTGGRQDQYRNNISSYSVCVKKSNLIRYDDRYCDRDQYGYTDWYLRPGQLAPRIGQRVNQGTLIRPKGRIQSRVPATGGTLQKSATPTKKSTPTTKSKPTSKPKTTKTKSKSSTSGSKSKSGSSRSGSGRR